MVFLMIVRCTLLVFTEYAIRKDEPTGIDPFIDPGIGPIRLYQEEIVEIR